jgi:hypothetical protein
MEAVRSSETSIDFYQTTRHFIPECLLSSLSFSNNWNEFICCFAGFTLKFVHISQADNFSACQVTPAFI